MNARHVTAVLILATILIWIAWDIYADVTAGYDATETAAIRGWSKVPFVPLVAGILIGHLFAC